MKNIRMMASIASLIAVVGAMVFAPVWAQQANNQGGGQGLEISPPLITLDADPGETRVIEISLRNITEIDVIAQGTVNDFVAKDESGDPQILFDESEPSPYPLAAYISSVPNLTIAPGQQEVARIPIVIPEDASPGAHMGVVRFSAVPAESSGGGSQVALSASIGTLVLLNVSGDVEEDLRLSELAVAQNGEIGSFFESGPLTLVTRLTNAGNVFIQPRGSLTLTNMFGQEVAVTQLESETASAEGEATSSIDFNPTDRNVLPDSTRRFEHAVDKSWWFGRYTLTASLAYGSDGETIEDSVTFWVIPYTMLAIVLIVLAVLAFLGTKGLKSYNRRVIARAQAHHAPYQQSPPPPVPPQQPPQPGQ